MSVSCNHVHKLPLFPFVSTLKALIYILGKFNSLFCCRWINGAKFLTGASAVGSMAIPIILRHAGLIGTGAMFFEFTSFFIFVCTVLCFHRASLDDEW